MAKVKVGLPDTVVFNYDKGVVTCFPKQNKWVVVLTNQKTFTHYQSGRNDVTKYKAKRFLKLSISGIWESDKK